MAHPNMTHPNMTYSLITQPQRSRTARVLITAAVSLLTLAALLTTSACNSKSTPTPENFTQALNAHFLDHSDCLLANTRFPYETTAKEETQQMDSLVKAQLLTKAEEMSIHASRYIVSTAGARYAPRFCYGHREVTTIDSFTPPAAANGFNETTVTYHYTMKDVPVWAKTPEVLAAFPQMAQAISSDSTAHITLAQNITGWQVPE